jgi:hypothetical protein
MIPQEDKNELTEMLNEKGIHFKPSIEIRIDRLTNIPLIEFEANNRNGAYNLVRKAMKPVANYSWDNSILRVSNIYGEEFSMAVYLTKIKGVVSHWEITLWDYKGTTTVGVWTKPYENDDDKITIDELRAIKERLEEFSHEVLHCSACQTTMPTNRRIKFNSDVHKKQYGGQYFAGHYCIDCWESKYKAIEAKETYE